MMKFLMKISLWCCWRGIYRTVDNTVIDTEEDNKKAKKTEITEFQEDYEVLDNVAFHSTKNTQLKTTESVAKEMTELPVENLNTD